MAIILWQGSSALDGKPIEVLCNSTPSRNEKTGPMLQTYILRSDIAPLTALTTGEDASICGNCSYRGWDELGNKQPRKCYVNVGKSVQQAWKSARRSEIRQSPRKAGAGKEVRIGAYGDPTAAPYVVWLELLSKATGHSGYTHQWKTCDQRFRLILMASVNNEAEQREAVAMGWKTYRAKLPEQPRLSGEFPCPASEESGKVLTCQACLRCDATRRNYVINAHGTGKRHFSLTLAP